MGRAPAAAQSLALTVTESCCVYTAQESTIYQLADNTRLSLDPELSLQDYFIRQLLSCVLFLFLPNLVDNMNLVHSQ